MISFYSCLLEYTCSQGDRRVRACCFQHGSGESRSVSLPPSARAQDSSYHASRSPSQNETKRKTPWLWHSLSDTTKIGYTTSPTTRPHRGRHRPKDRENCFLTHNKPTGRRAHPRAPTAPRNSPSAPPATRSGQDHEPPRRPTDENRLLSAAALSSYLFLMCLPGFRLAGPS